MALDQVLCLLLGDADGLELGPDGGESVTVCRATPSEQRLLPERADAIPHVSDEPAVIMSTPPSVASNPVPSVVPEPAAEAHIGARW